MAVETAPIRLEQRQQGSVTLTGGDLVRIETRRLTAEDDPCGDAEICYLPLTKLAHSTPVYTLLDEFRGQGLGVNWRLANKSSSFVGNFKY